MKNEYKKHDLHTDIKCEKCGTSNKLIIRITGKKDSYFTFVDGCKILCQNCQMEMIRFKVKN